MSDLFHEDVPEDYIAPRLRGDGASAIGIASRC